MRIFNAINVSFRSFSHTTRLDDHTLVKGAKLSSASEDARGLIERCSSGVKGAGSFLKDKAVSFVSSIKKGATGLRNRNGGKNATKGLTLVPLSVLEKMGKVVVEAATDNNAGLFRLSPGETGRAKFERVLSKNPEGKRTVSGDIRDEITSHLKDELKSLAPNRETFDGLVALKKEMDGENDLEKQRLYAKSAVQLFVSNSGDTERASKLLNIFSQCYALAPTNGGKYNKTVFDTAVASCLLAKMPPLDLGGALRL
ncbi:Uncharacterised protein [Iodobacter fluviatilis]|uniref:Uncharacterized protein n=1 Tax=Iodobacter fluviatilis TaxID=537 RepID=A0A377Q5W7_9NEIS|nr:hypothetical protein [Iodobacter fluviatilis]STQ90158.1 Uncharacterised protein [Iodobacter fluviatilis]